MAKLASAIARLLCLLLPTRLASTSNGVCHSGSVTFTAVQNCTLNIFPSATLSSYQLSCCSSLACEEFEDWAASRGGFEVHAFDPTARTKRSHEAHTAPGVHFHYFGLGDEMQSPRHSLGYGHIGGEMQSLAELTRRLGHTDRPIRLLHIDTEGAEWAALAHVADNAPQLLASVCTLIMELHLAPRLGANTTNDLKHVAVFWEAVVEKAGFRFWYVHANPGGFPNEHGLPGEAVHPMLKQLGADPGTCCYEVALHREGCRLTG